MLCTIMGVIIIIISISHHFRDILCQNVYDLWYLEWVKVKYKFLNQKPMCNFLFHGNVSQCYVSHIFYRLRYSLSRNCNTLTVTFRIDQGLYVNRKLASNFLFVANSSICPIYYSFRDIRSRNVNDIWRSLDWAKVKCKYTNWNTVYDFLLFGNSNVYPTITICAIY